MAPSVIIIKEQTTVGYDGLYEGEYNIKVESSDWNRGWESFEKFDNLLSKLKSIRNNRPDLFTEGDVRQPIEIQVD